MDCHVLLGVLVDGQVHLLVVVVENGIEAPKEHVSKKEHERITNNLWQGNDAEDALVVELQLRAQVCCINEVAVRRNIKVRVINFYCQVA